MDFVLVLAVLIPIVLGILQVALVLLVRNTLAAAASEGARYAATSDRDPQDGVELTRDQIDGAISERFAQDIEVRRVLVGGSPAVEITVHASVPALGLGGPSIDLDVSGRAIEEDP
ncbi:TadE family protein [Nocardioides sp.]|uniref:TadE family protein n=1 Tax=Nocardioides sp. TaxID=35761 RepID=UPI0031FEEE3C